MGIWRDGYDHHEGIRVAYVEREDCSLGSRIFRELGYPNDNADEYPIVRIGAGCSCGWRSQTFVPRFKAEWMPHIPLLSHHDDEVIHRLWDRHIEQDCTRDTPPSSEPILRLPLRWREDHLAQGCRECEHETGITRLRRSGR